MKSSRMFQIVYRLLRSGETTAPALAAELEVSVRTIYRDVEALSQAGVPIYAAQGRGGGIHLMEGFVMNKALMSPQEQEKLLLAVQSLASATQEDNGALVAKLGALFRSDSTNWLRVDFRQWGPVISSDGRFDQIKTALLEKRILRFDYAGFDGSTSRRVKPALLYYKGSAWYLQAFCLLRNEFRTFKISRMSALELTQESFGDMLVPPPLEPWEHLDCWPEVRLRFAARAAYRVYDAFDEECILREPDGSLLVTTRQPLGDGWLCGRLLSFGTDVQVLSPNSLRQELAEQARRLYQHHQIE